jgi:hypothetical protein
MFGGHRPDAELSTRLGAGNDGAVGPPAGDAAKFQDFRAVEAVEAILVPDPRAVLVWGETHAAEPIADLKLGEPAPFIGENVGLDSV